MYLVPIRDNTAGLRRFILAVLVANPLYVFAQTAPCDSPEYTQFDFWVGLWVVHTPEGELAGYNTITREEGQCLIVERWRGAQGSTGQSYNFYDPAAGQWRQVWVSQGAIIDYSGGLTASGAMHLKGTITANTDGRQTPFRGTWTPKNDGSVEQHLEIYQGETESWQTWFLGLYTRPGE